jgi:hypothetical protein
MIHSIQRFTTQRIPPATIVGLEPRRPEPKPAQPERFAPGRGKPHRAGFGARPGSAAPWAKPSARNTKPRPAR